MHTLPPLPYAMDALAPHISASTLEFHHGKHHQTYVTNLNNLLKDSADLSLSLEDIIIKSHKEGNTPVFNNAAQVWNHTFYWHCMKQNGGGEPTGPLMAKITAAFGSLDNFKAEFKKAALAQFGSGWAWLVEKKNGELEIMKTPNADLPMVHDAKALLTIDVWEHAYYLDYQNRRADYVDTFFAHLINWGYVSSHVG